MTNSTEIESSAVNITLPSRCNNAGKPFQSLTPFRVPWLKLQRGRGYSQRSLEEDHYLQTHEETEIAEQRGIKTRPTGD